MSRKRRRSGSDRGTFDGGESHEDVTSVPTKRGRSSDPSAGVFPRETILTLPEEICCSAWRENLLVIGLGHSRGRVAAIQWDSEEPVRLWDAGGHAGSIVCGVSLSRDGEMAASAAEDGTVVVWAARSGRRLARTETRSPLEACAWLQVGNSLSECLVAAGRDGKVHRCALVPAGDGTFTLEPAAPPRALDHGVTSLASDGRNGVALGMVDGSVCVLGLADGGDWEERHAATTVHADSIHTMAWSSCGGLLLTGSADGVARVLAVPSSGSSEEDASSPIATQSSLVGHDAWVTACSFLPGDRGVVTADRHGRVALWEGATAALLAFTPAEGDWFTSLQLVGGDARVDTTEGERPPQSPPHAAATAASAVRVLATSVAHESFLGRIQVWNAAYVQRFLGVLRDEMGVTDGASPSTAWRKAQESLQPVIAETLSESPRELHIEFEVPLEDPEV